MGSNWKFTLLILGLKRDDFCNPVQSWKYLEDSQDKIVVTQSFVEEECVTSQKNVYLGGYTFYSVAETLSRKTFVR